MMKKMLLVALFSVMCLVGINNVSAMTEDELKSKLAFVLVWVQRFFVYNKNKIIKW